MTNKQRTIKNLEQAQILIYELEKDKEELNHIIEQQEKYIQEFESLYSDDGATFEERMRNNL